MIKVIKQYWLVFGMLIVLSMAIISDRASAAPHDEHCDQVEEVAEAVMEARQRGVPARDMLGIANDDITRAIVIDAYDSQRYSSHTLRERAVRDFAERVYITCHKVYQGG